MKRIVYSLLTLGATLALAFSCTKEPEAPNPDPSFGGTPVKVTFNVDLRGALTKADTPETTDLDNAAGDYRLYVAAFSKTDGSLISTSRIGGTGYEATGTVTDGKGTVTLTLSKKQEYQVVFFAQKDESYAVDFASGNKAQFSYKTGLKANDATLDAFWAVLPVSSATTTYDVTLKRPFAQLNVLVPADNVPEGQTTFNSTMKVKAPTAFDLFAGSATGTVSEIEFASNGINAPAFGKYKTGYAWIGMNYVLVPTAGTVEVVSFNENGMQKPVAPGAVPVKVNSRTNMVGNLYSMDADFTFNITINPATEEEGEDPLGGTDTEVTIADGATYTENSPLEINASAATKSVTLTINGSEKISDVEEASGEKVTATTSDDKVATAAVSGDNVVITGVGNGDAVITVTTPSYTKATYKGGALAIPVRVSGFKSDVAITVTAPTGNKLALVTGKTGTITATAKDAAGNAVDIVYTSSDEKVATVTAGTVTAVAAGSATITLSTEATATLNAAAPVSIAVTVTDPETTGKTIAELKALMDDGTSGAITESVTLGTVSVTGVYNNNKNAYIEDATGGAVIYSKDEAISNLEAGKAYTGIVVSSTTMYNTYLYEITGYSVDDATSEELNALPETELTIAQINEDLKKYQYVRTKLVGVTNAAKAVSSSNKTVELTQGTDKINGYFNYNNVDIKLESVMTVVGYPNYHSGSNQITILSADNVSVTTEGIETTSISISNQQLTAGSSLDLSSVVTVTPDAAVSSVQYALVDGGSSNITLSGSTVSVSATATAGETASVKLSVAAVAGSYSAAEKVITITVKSADTTDPTSYTLDSDAIKAAHTQAWSYTSGSKTITATDGSEWTAYNTFASTNQVTVQMNKGKDAYVLTPTVPSGKKITKITVVTNTKNDGSGTAGDRPLDIQSADGKSTLHANVTNYAEGLEISGEHTALRVICNESNGGATYIVSITIDFE